MASPISPSNGFITRLLQQTTHTPTKSAVDKHEAPASKPDQTSISQEARQAASNADSNKQVESKLIELYNQKGKGRSV